MIAPTGAEGELDSGWRHWVKSAVLRHILAQKKEKSNPAEGKNAQRKNDEPVQK
jgi:hypothetical protein